MDITIDLDQMADGAMKGIVAMCFAPLLATMPPEELVRLYEQTEHHDEGCTQPDVRMLFQAAITGLWVKTLRDEIARRPIS